MNTIEKLLAIMNKEKVCNIIIGGATLVYNKTSDMAIEIVMGNKTHHARVVKYIKGTKYNKEQIYSVRNKKVEGPNRDNILAQVENYINKLSSTKFKIASDEQLSIMDNRLYHNLKTDFNNLIHGIVRL